MAQIAPTVHHLIPKAAYRHATSAKPGRPVVFENLLLTELEILTLEQFAPFLGGSPRRAKRFINLYHLLKASLHSQRLDADGDERIKPLAVIAMLAMVTSAPEAAVQFFRCHRQTVMAWIFTRYWNNCRLIRAMDVKNPAV